MTQIVHLIGRFFNADEARLGVECSAFIVTTPPSRQKVGAGGDLQTTVYPTAITLYDVNSDSLAAIRKQEWTHILQTESPGPERRELQIGRIEIDCQNVKVIV